MSKKSLDKLVKKYWAYILIAFIFSALFLGKFQLRPASIDPSAYSYYEFGKYGYVQYNDIIDYTAKSRCRDIPSDDHPRIVLRIATLPVCQWSPDDPSRGDTQACGRNMEKGIYANPEPPIQRDNFNAYGLEYDSYIRVTRDSDGKVFYERTGSDIPKSFAGAVWLNNYPNPPDKIGFGFVFGLSGYDGAGEETEICTYRYHINFATSTPPPPPQDCRTLGCPTDQICNLVGSSYICQSKEYCVVNYPLIS